MFVTNPHYDSFHMNHNKKEVDCNYSWLSLIPAWLRVRCLYFYPNYAFKVSSSLNQQIRVECFLFALF